MRKQSKEDEQTLVELNTGCRRSQPKCQLVQTSYITYNKHLINRVEGVSF